MVTMLLSLSTLLEVVRRGSVAHWGGQLWETGVLYGPTGRPLSSDPLFLNLTESGLGFGH